MPRLVRNAATRAQDAAGARARRELNRERNSAERLDDQENKIREAVHDASGSPITANSRRLRTVTDP